MKPFIIHDSDIKVNVSIRYSSNLEQNEVQIISKNNECFIFPEEIVKKNISKNTLKLLNVDDFGILNSFSVMNTFNQHKKKKYE